MMSSSICGALIYSTRHNRNLSILWELWVRLLLEGFLYHWNSILTTYSKINSHPSLLRRPCGKKLSILSNKHTFILHKAQKSQNYSLKWNVLKVKQHIIQAFQNLSGKDLNLYKKWSTIKMIQHAKLLLVENLKSWLRKCKDEMKRRKEG